MKKSVKKAIKILVVIFAVIIAVSLGLSFLNKPADTGNTATQSVIIEEGYGTAEIAETLKKADLIRSVKSFKILSKLWRYDGKYKTGTYEISPSMTVSDIAKKIISGKTATRSVTIPEGYTLREIAKKLDKDGIVDKKEFLDAAAKNDAFKEYSFLKKAQSGKNRLEGYLFPDTYSVAVNAGSEEIIKTMLTQFNSIFTDEDRAKAKKLGYTENEIIIIASMIEREAQVPEDRKKVSSVIYNRLKRDMPLQFCSTVQYILGKHKEVLSYADTHIDSPYNTYKNKGLPKGPICSPGRASIEAALNPANTKYLYFVVSDKLDGSNKFSANEADFEKNKQAYSKALKNRDSKK